MTAKQSNMLGNIRVICRGDRAENYEFNGAAAYAMDIIKAH
jgi:hypothetical protein